MQADKKYRGCNQIWQQLKSASLFQYVAFTPLWDQCKGITDRILLPIVT
jgi:hypothetical protein